MSGDDWILSEIGHECRSEICDLAGMANPAVDTQFPDPVHLRQSRRRTLVRSIFAFLEAMTFAIKNQAVAYPMTSPSPEEFHFVREEDFDIDERGKLRTMRARLRLLPNIRFTFDLYSKLNNLAPVLDCSGIGWQQLVSSVKVRDRLMHPKSVQDLFVTDHEIQDALSVFVWFDQMWLALLEAHIQELRDDRLRMEAMIDHLRG